MGLCEYSGGGSDIFEDFFYFILYIVRVVYILGFSVRLLVILEIKVLKNEFF